MELRGKLKDCEEDRNVIQNERERRREEANGQLPPIYEPEAHGEPEAAISENRLVSGRSRVGSEKFGNNEWSGVWNTNRNVGESSKWWRCDFDFRRGNIEIPSGTEVHVSMLGEIQDARNGDGEVEVLRALSILEYLVIV